MAESLRSTTGRGWAFPIRIDGRGGIALASEEENIRRGMFLILSTAKGERRMRPHFGCGVHDLVFSPNDATTAGLIDYHVREALGWWEPRIKVADVQISRDPDNPGKVLVEVKYFVKTTKIERSLVYPFYLIPGEE